ncbi:hypothetical protein CMV_012010 [Castanea mollissima]|uniref:Uncharacterized protein n=1 Tax=Castanea mollissima TaxID=60419 RepID=A0A8J4R265_9ROSI|nr:hypothetical protein CMV_012010 [Castanea mollissima]
MTCNHVWFLKLYESPIDSKDLNQFEWNYVEVEFGAVSHILRCGVHAEYICPLVQDLSTDHLPPTSIPAFPTCSISNTVTPSPHLLNSCLELSNSNSMETTYNDGCDLSLSLCTSPMGRNYPPPQPQVTVPDDTSHILNNMADMFELRLGLPGLGIASTASEGFHLGSSSMAHNYECAAVRPEQSTSQFVSSNSASTENLSSTSRPRLIESEDRLPGTVLLARARLLERLRGVPLSANRESGRPLSDRPELTLVDDRDLGTQASAGQSAGGSSITSLTSQIERL